MGLNYSQEAKKAKANFYNQFNDIDIFIEDKASCIQELYRIIFKKIFREIKIDQIFPLGGKSQVRIEYNRNKNNIKEKPSLFIIDGDLDLFYAKPTSLNNIKSKSYLCCLNRYSIENYLIEKKAIISTIEKEDPIKKIEIIEQKLDYDNWIIKNFSLLELFIYYSIIHEKKLGIPNVNYGVFKLCHETDNDGVIDETKIKGRIENIKNEIIFKNNDNLKEIYKDRSKLLSKKNNLVIYVAGKNLIQLIFKRSRIITGRIGNRKNATEIFMQKLAMECEFKDLRSLLKPFITNYYCIKEIKK